MPKTKFTLEKDAREAEQRRRALVGLGTLFDSPDRR